jgi:hypothetical protein
VNTTAVVSRPTTGPTSGPDPLTGPITGRRSSPLRRFFGVVARPQSYRNLAYLLVGLPLGTLWFALLVTLLSTSVSLLVVALIGLPLLVGTWYAVRAGANVERVVADTLLDQPIPRAPLAGPPGNLWVRCKAMTGDRRRWRELGFLLARFPAGIATFTAAVTALAVPVLVAYTPIHGRYVDQDFGDWFWSSELEHFASTSAWSWLLVPLGLGLMFVAFHLLNALARACGRWAVAWLGDDQVGLPASVAPPR